MSTNTLTLLQEVYFDLCDLLEYNKLGGKVKGLYEFDDLREFITEQKRKIAEIEINLDVKEEV